MSALLISLGDIQAEVVLKDIKNIHLSVYPPSGRVRISAPERMSVDNVRAYAVSKLKWIKRQQTRIQDQDRETRREFVSGESHYLWGKRFLLKMEALLVGSHVRVRGKHIIFSIRAEASREQREEVFEAWYRDQIRNRLQEMLPKWESQMSLKAEQIVVRRMRTMWGRCSPSKATIRLNTELAKKPVECLEYILVHELAHLKIPNHGEQFVTLLDQHLPSWKKRREILNSLPVRHEKWDW